MIYSDWYIMKNNINSSKTRHHLKIKASVNEKQLNSYYSTNIWIAQVHNRRNSKFLNTSTKCHTSLYNNIALFENVVQGCLQSCLYESTQINYKTNPNVSVLGTNLIIVLQLCHSILSIEIAIRLECSSLL